MGALDGWKVVDTLATEFVPGHYDQLSAHKTVIQYCVYAGCTRGRYADTPLCKLHKELGEYRQESRRLHAPASNTVQ